MQVESTESEGAQLPYPVRSTIGGRAEPIPEAQPSAQFFGRYQTGGALGILDADTPTETIWPRGVDGCGADRVWLIGSYTKEVYRNSANGGLGPLPRSTILNPVPAGAVVPTIVGGSRVALQLRLGGEGGERVYEIDSGQELLVVAKSIQIRALVPNEANEVIASVVNPVVDGNVFDALMTVRILKVEMQHGRWENARTLNLRQAAGAANVGIAIPAGTVSFQIFQTTAGVASVEWQQRIGSPAGVNTQLSVIPWLAGARKTEPIERRANATHLVPDVDLVNIRDFVAVFQIRP